MVSEMSVKQQAVKVNKKAVHIEISDAFLRYRDSAEVIFSRLNMHIPAGLWTCILGRSGCGKSSLLKYLANLLEDKVDWAGELHTQPSLSCKNQIAYMAQQDLLMPWLSVLDNVLLSTKFGKTQKYAQRDNAMQLLKKVGLADRAKSLPQQLSGGMRQRVALARTLMQDKPVVLMDEPFSALDAVTRLRLQNLACELLQDKTVVLITHDPQEAIRLADQLYIMRGRPAVAELLQLPQSATPRKPDLQCAQLQQQIIERLEQDHE